MGRIITIASAKGGVGKTTICANLAAALSEFKKSVIAVDANLTTANLGLHFGLPLYPVTLQDVIRKKANIKDAIYNNHYGFKIIPADISIKKVMTPKGGFSEYFWKLAEKTDFILIDSAAGLGPEALAALETADEVITITNPEMPALTDALKLTETAKKYKVSNLGFVLNRVKDEKHEISINSAREFLELPLLGKVNEDYAVKQSIAKRRPVVLHKPNSLAARQIKSIAAKLIGKEYKIKRPIFQRLFTFLKQ